MMLTFFPTPPSPLPRPHGCRSEVLTLNQRLVAGMFTLQPAFGTIQPGQVQKVVVEFTADTAGKFEEVGAACEHTHTHTHTHAHTHLVPRVSLIEGYSDVVP